MMHALSQYMENDVCTHNAKRNAQTINQIHDNETKCVNSQ